MNELFSKTGISRVDTPNGGANSIKSEPEMNGVETDDEVNVDRDIEDDDKQKDLADIVNEHVCLTMLISLEIYLIQTKYLTS